jgi:hypothetical protein
MGADRDTAQPDSGLSLSAPFGPMGASCGEIAAKLHRAAKPDGGVSLRTEFFSVRRCETYRAGGRFRCDARLIASASVRSKVRV